MASTGLVRLPGDLVPLYGRAFQPDDGRLELGDRISTVHRVPNALFGFDQVLSAWLYLAVTGSSGQAVSLDRFLVSLVEARARAAISRSRHKDGPRPPVAPMARPVPAPTVSANLAFG